MPWNPELYHKFQAERFAPFEDLVKLVRERELLRVIDLGCGTGELTRRLADRLPHSEVLGVDSSPEMLARAKLQARPGLRFELQRVEEVEGTWDLIFSNAVLQWVDDHAALIPRLQSMVNEGGQLVVQIPSNHSHPSQALIEEVAREEPFRSELRGWIHQWPVLRVHEYAELLHASGGQDLTVYEKVYPHYLEDSDAIADWTSGTALVPYFERMSSETKAAFLQRYREMLRGVWPQGPVFYGFRRTLFAATRA